MDKVHQRIGRVREKYPSAQQYYTIEVSADEKSGKATEITWQIDQEKYKNKIANLGPIMNTLP